MAGLHFDITGDNSEFMDALRETERGIKSTAKSVEQSGMSMESMFGKLGKAVAGMGVAFSAQQFIGKMAMVRGEFQQLEVAFETMLGSTEKASALMAQITNTAAVTPFGLQDVANGAKQLLAYGVASEEVNDTLVRLGDIAAGLSIPLNDLVYLYGTTMTQGRMFTQDLRQFQGRGIPLADELAKQFSVTKDAVGELVTAGKVGFKEMQQAIISMTSEGGKFGGLMEAQSKTITGQISNIEDAIDQMFNELGKSSEGIINLTLSGVSAIVENYELVGKALMGVVATYGAYRAAVIANIALTRSWAVAARADAAAKAIQTVATKAQTVATLALNAAMKANPFVLVATGVVALGTAMWALKDNTTAAEKGLAQYNEEQERLHNQQVESKRQLEELVSVLQDENAEYGKREYAIKQMKALYPDLAQMFIDEKGHILDLTGLWEEYGKKASKARLESQEAKVAGLSSELTIAQNNYNTAKANSNWGAVKKYKERVDEITAELDAAKKELTQLTEEQKKKEEAPLVKNKSYWEKQKKDAETSRDALDVQEVNSEKWKEYTKKIIEAEKQLAKYATPSKTNKDAEQKAKEEQKLADALLKQRRDNTQAEIDLMAEGGEKKRKQIELNYQLEIDEVRKQKREWEQAQNGILTEEQRIALGNKASNAMKTRESGLAKLTKEETEAATQAMNEYLREYGTWMEKRQAISKIYTEKINKATTQGEKLTLAEQMKRELAQVDDEAHGRTTSIAKLFEDMSEKTVASMREIADEAETVLAYLKAGKWEEVIGTDGKGTGKDAFGFTKEQYDLLKMDAEQLKAISDRIKEIYKNADEAEPKLKKMAQSFKNIFKGNYSEGKFEEELGNILDGVSAITQAAEFLGDSLSTMSEAFGGNFMGGIAEGIGVATDAANAAMSGAEAGKVFGPWGAAAGAAIGAISSLTKSFAQLHDKKHEKKIQKLAEQIEVLEKSYEVLGDKIEDAYSNDASNLIASQNKLLEQQKVLIRQQIAEEEKKKKTDQSRIKEWQEQLEEINKTIEDNKEKAIDAIFGSDLKSAIEDFASAYSEAWSTGEDRAKSAKEVVKNMIKSMIMESIKATASAPMQKLRDLMVGFFSDGVISMWEEEQLYKAAEKAQKQLDDKYGWADRFMVDSSYEQEASSKGFETMNQETASELNGRFAALQISNEEIKNQMVQSVVLYTQMLALTSQNNGVLNDILAQHAISNGYLADIAKYSKIMSAYGEKIDKIVENTQNL